MLTQKQKRRQCANTKASIKAKGRLTAAKVRVMSGEKIEGGVCAACGCTVRYVNISNRAKEGKCVDCVDRANDRAKKKTFACRVASEGIDQPYKACYESGYRAKSTTINPYQVSEIGKRCAWQAGFNDAGHTI